MKRCAPIAAILTVTCLAFLVLPAADVPHWPTFRGPLGTGVAPGANPPVEWAEGKNVRWKVELPGAGHATPVVWGDRIFVMSAVQTNKVVEPPAPAPSSRHAEHEAPVLLAVQTQDRAQGEQPPPQGGQAPPEGGQPRGRMERPPAPTNVHRFVVSAIDRGTGKTLWETTVREEVPHEAGHPTASQASASPVTDGEHVWAHFGSRGLYCLDRDGKIVWQKDLGKMATRNEFGEGSSPALHGDTLVVQWDHEGDSFIVALDKKSGEERWRVARDEPTSWATPLVLQDGDRRLVLTSGTNRVRAYDLKTGELVWHVGGLGANCIPSPVEHDGIVFVMSGYRDPAGMAIRYRGATGDLDGTERVLWSIKEGTSYVPSPLLYEGRLYFIERFRAMLSNYDLATGKVHYTQQRIEGMGSIYASPVAASGRIYLLDREGVAVVFRHGETFEELARNKLDDGFDATPVIVGDNLYLRGHKYLYNIAAM